MTLLNHRWINKAIMGPFTTKLQPLGGGIGTREVEKLLKKPRLWGAAQMRYHSHIIQIYNRRGVFYFNERSVTGKVCLNTRTNFSSTIKF